MDEIYSGSLGKITAANPKDIVEFLNLLEKYPSEMAADFRRFFSISIWDIPTKVSWAEAILLLSHLLKNTESSTLAAKNQWTTPFSYSDIIQLDEYDLQYAGFSGKKERYKRPWEAPKTISKGTMPLDKAVEFFARLGHK